MQQNGEIFLLLIKSQIISQLLHKKFTKERAGQIWAIELGTGVLAPKDKKYWPYEKAKEFAQSSGIKSSKQWSLASKAGKLPADLPADPARKYEQKGWITWGDFLGTGRIADQQKEFWPYEKARDFVHTLKLKDEDEWYSYCKSGKKPPEVPTAVRSAYKDKGWKSMGDWLGTAKVATFDRKYRSFEEAREYARSLNRVFAFLCVNCIYLANSRKFSNCGLDKTFLNLPRGLLRRSGGRRVITMYHKNNYCLTA
jgi:hypothetical protein